MLAGKLSYIEGAREIVAAATAARLDERDATCCLSLVSFPKPTRYRLVR
jgi:hypothetical protein